MRLDPVRSADVGTVLLLGVCLGMACSAALAEEDAKKPDEKQRVEMVAKRRLAVMQSAIDDFKVSSDEIKDEATLKFGKGPVLRYDDQTRQLLDAGVWRLGEKGRPTALVTMEIYTYREDLTMLTYEFVSLSEPQFSMRSIRGPQWIAIGTDLKMRPLTDAPPPSDSEKTRLIQMRQLARRFYVREQLGKEKVECRLMPQPIDRYSDPDKKILDGGIFAFANGTNPEIGLVLECYEKDWSYGVFRLSAAASFIELDGKAVDEFPSAKYSAQATYTATRHPIERPE